MLLDKLQSIFCLYVCKCYANTETACALWKTSLSIDATSSATIKELKRVYFWIPSSLIIDFNLKIELFTDKNICPSCQIVASLQLLNFHLVVLHVYYITQMPRTYSNHITWVIVIEGSRGVDRTIRCLFEWLNHISWKRCWYLMIHLQMSTDLWKVRAILW